MRLLIFLSTILAVHYSGNCQSNLDSIRADRCVNLVSETAYSLVNNKVNRIAFSIYGYDNSEIVFQIGDSVLKPIGGFVVWKPESLDTLSVKYFHRDTTNFIGEKTFIVSNNIEVNNKDFILGNSTGCDELYSFKNNLFLKQEEWTRFYLISKGVESDKLEFKVDNGDIRVGDGWIELKGIESKTVTLRISLEGIPARDMQFGNI